VILSILEEFFERDKRIGEILLDMGEVSHKDLAQALELQGKKHAGKRLGEILLEERLATQEAVDRALLIQNRNDGSFSAAAP
jgi:hypothetical protein